MAAVLKVKEVTSVVTDLVTRLVPLGGGKTKKKELEYPRAETVNEGGGDLRGQAKSTHS